jgi:hypothetical protein
MADGLGGVRVSQRKGEGEETKTMLSLVFFIIIIPTCNLWQRRPRASEKRRNFHINRTTTQ